MNRLTDPPAIIRSVNELAEQINAAHHQVETAFRSGLEHARRAGELLSKAKSQCRHGEWLTWLAAHVQCTERTAQRYMTIAQRWDELANTTRVSYLSYRGALALLSAPSEDQTIAPPALNPDCGYIVDGQHEQHGPSWLEIDPHPDHPGYWIYSFYFGIDRDPVEAVSCYRGMRLDAETLAQIMRRMGFAPTAAWQETEPTEPPDGWREVERQRVIPRRYRT